MALLIIELVLCIVFALLLYQCCAKRATAMDGDGDDLESFRQRMGTTRESTEEGNRPEAIAARKELIHKNLFSRQIQREESVKELAQLLAISRGRATEMDEEMGSGALGNETFEDSSAPIKGEDNFSSEIPPGGDAPTPSAPPLTQTDNIASAIYTPADTNNTLERRPENATAETTATTTPDEGGFIRNLWKGLTQTEQPPPQSQAPATSTPQCQLHQQHKLECSICLDEYTPNDTISWAKDGGDPPSASVALTNTSGAASGCDHIFHQGCLVSWLEHHDDCPLCRRKLVHEDADVRFSGAGWELGQ
mmetsp:Transcript_9267/g.15819  ORF Transcript_9267/g.15819 Transcript_9267/m.15819 type:complete len:307 (-) Transcript_9267:1068-1988(-)